MKFPDLKHIKGNVFVRIRETPSTTNPMPGEQVTVLYHMTLVTKTKDDYMESVLDLSGEPFDQSPHEMYLDADDVQEILEFLEEIEATPEPVM